MDEDVEYGNIRTCEDWTMHCAPGNEVLGKLAQHLEREGCSENPPRSLASMPIAFFAESCQLRALADLPISPAAAGAFFERAFRRSIVVSATAAAALAPDRLAAGSSSFGVASCRRCTRLAGRLYSG